ncbi:hypothetical protein B0H10DRAFT_1981085, partial [Mycena sp. CBHHK59/15]
MSNSWSLRMGKSSSGSAVSSTELSKRAKDGVVSSHKRPLVLLDDGCFLTGFTCCSLEPVHIVNPVRHNKDDMKAKVIAFLKDYLYIIHPENRATFSLESATNLVLLYLHHHRHLDTYGTYVLVPSKVTLKLLIHILKIANERWAQAVEKDNTAEREIDWPHRLIAYDLILLHPSAFLIGGQPMLAAGDPNINPRTFSLWSVQSKELHQHSEGPNSPLYQIISRTSNRAPQDQTNPFLFILNAALKLDCHL